MSRGIANKLYRNFTKGLITEASPLTYPENACADLDNCVIFRKGNISRRFGFDYETGTDTIAGLAYNQSDVENQAFTSYKWEAVANNAAKNFLVIQGGTSVFFYDMSYTPLTAGLKSFSFNLSSFFAPNTTLAQASACRLQYANGKGYLFIVGEHFEPILVEYLPGSDAIRVSRLYIQIRDFQGVNDSLANDEEPTTLSTEHNYNLLNQGWYAAKNDGSGPTVSYFDAYGALDTYNAPAQTPISDYYTSQSRYPGNNKQWWVAKDSTTNNFDPALLTKFNFGSGRAPRGHFVLNAFYKDRTAMSGLSGIPVESRDDRPSSVAFFSGRVWYVCGSDVYFSQIIDDKAKAGFCYQEADPTSEDFSDLVATDGGVITLPEMGKGLKLLPAAGGILVFANNGIWHISGTAGGFTALDYSTTRVSPMGIEAPYSVTETKEGIYWWGKTGIQGLVVQTGAGGTSFSMETISEQSIQTLFNNVPLENRQYVKGKYDPATNTIQWLYNDTDTLRPVANRILVLDLTLGAFYPWSFDQTGPMLMDVFLNPTLIDHACPYPTSIKKTFFKYIAYVPIDTRYYFVFADNKDYRFRDWATYLDGGINYESYLVSGYELLDDAMRKKEQNFVFAYFNKTEVNYVVDGDDWAADYPSSCLFQTRWDWSDTSTSGKWTNYIEAYRHPRIPMVDEDNPVFDTGHAVVVSKNKVRGHGRSIQFRFVSNGIGKNFDLLGWAVPFSGNTNP